LNRDAIGIVGVGHIGGSIGMRARRNGSAVFGYDIEPARLAEAIEYGAIDMAASLEELYDRAATVVIATYLDDTVAELERLRRAGRTRAALIIDVASVKKPVVDAAFGVRNFVATHPMAGTERSGIRAANGDLFETRTWAFVSSGDPKLDARASAFIASFGAAPLAVDAEEHDRIVAFTSHLPQVLAWAYGRQAATHSSEIFDPLIGRTANELLRLSRSGDGFWRSVLRANAANVEPELRALANALLEAADALLADDDHAVGRAADLNRR